jgi:hypothetical protein
MAAFWDIVLCSLIEVDQLFRSAASVIRVHIALMMEAGSISETLLNFYETTWHTVPEDCGVFNLIATRT